MRIAFRVVLGRAKFVWLQAEQGGDATRQTEDWTAVVKGERLMLRSRAGNACEYGRLPQSATTVIPLSERLNRLHSSHASTLGHEDFPYAW